MRTGMKFLTFYIANSILATANLAFLFLSESPAGKLQFYSQVCTWFLLIEWFIFAQTCSDDGDEMHPPLHHKKLKQRRRSQRGSKTRSLAWKQKIESNKHTGRSSNIFFKDCVIVRKRSQYSTIFM